MSSLGSFLLVLLFSAFCILSSSSDKAIPLITVNENGENGEANFVLNQEAISMIEKVSSPVKVIAAIGDARVGKSTALNFIHYTLRNVRNSAFHTTKNVEEIFETGNSMAEEAPAVIIWISTVRIPGNDDMENIILLDVEGTGLGYDTVTDKLSIFTALTSSCLTLFMKEYPRAHILDFLYKTVRLTEKAFGEKESEHFPRLTAVLLGALAPPEGYDTIDKYIIDSLVAPKWKDESDEKRKVIGKRFPRDRISVFDLPLLPKRQISFQSFFQLIAKSHGYLDTIEKLTTELMKLPEKKTLNGGLMDGQTLADLVQRLVDVMNDHEELNVLHPIFYELFEKEVCAKSVKKHIDPLSKLSSKEMERQRLRALNNLRANCKLEEYISNANYRLEMELEWKKTAQREREKSFPTDGLWGTLIAGIMGAAVSDVQLKENVTTLLNNSEYETIGLRGVEWVWNQEAERLGLSGKGSGVVAQEVELLYPWAVTEGYDGYKRVNYSALRLLIWVKKFRQKAVGLVKIVTKCGMPDKRPCIKGLHGLLM